MPVIATPFVCIVFEEFIERKWTRSKKRNMPIVKYGNSEMCYSRTIAWVLLSRGSRRRHAGVEPPPEAI